MSERTKFYVSVNMFVVRDGMILLGLRKKIGDNTWGLPGGHLEEYESLEQAALRELAEETGLIATQCTFTNLLNDPHHGTHYIHTAFEIKNIIGEPRVCEPDKCSEWRFFSLDALPDNMYPPNAELIKLYISGNSFGELSR